MSRRLAVAAPLLVIAYSMIWVVDLAIGVQFPWWDQMFAPAIMVLLSFSAWYQQRARSADQRVTAYQAKTIEIQLEMITELQQMLAKIYRDEAL